MTTSKPKLFYFDLNSDHREKFTIALTEAGYDVTAPESVQEIWMIKDILDFAMHIVARDNDANKYTREIMKELQLKAVRASKTKNFFLLAFSPSKWHEISCNDYANKFFLLPKDDAVRAFVLKVQRILQENESIDED